jgi:hypothetical protein
MTSILNLTRVPNCKHSLFNRYINSMWNNTVDSDQVVAALLRRAIEPLLLLYRVRQRACTRLHCIAR